MGAQADKVRRELEQALAGVKKKTAERLLEKVQESTPVRTGYTQSRWELTEDGVTNDQGDTIMRLNDGSSTQEPAGFIERAIDETVVEMEREVKK